MSDAGHDETEKILKKLEKEISKEYAQAEKEIEEKLQDYFRRFQIKDEIKRQAVLDGKITQKEYNEWRIGQLAIGERWEEMKDTIAQDLANTSQIAKSVANGVMPDVYALNHNYATFQVEKASLVDTSYTLYNRDSVARLFDDKKTFYHKAGKKLMKDIKMGKQIAWNKKSIQSALIQGILQGESIGKMATRIAKTTGDKDRKATIRNVRTMTTGIQNAGRMDSYVRAEKMGIKLMQEWVATLDGRTRHEHRMLDGQRVAIGDKFKVDGYELEYPGDPAGEPYLIYNCRCTTIAVFEGFGSEASNLEDRNTNKLGDMTYDEWKNEKKENIKSDRITKQDEIEKTMKEIYNAEYKRLKS